MLRRLILRPERQTERFGALFTHPARPLVIAHRGASANAPENTLAAFREAVAQGADGVELDVMVCGSGEVVVCHDEWLDRLAGEHVPVGETPLHRLRGLDVGRWFSPAFARECIPTLDEVFDLLPQG
ncbi:MAG: glycerophosphodiester phosphodiesterase, partial [Myxococcales bacterium]